MRTVLVSGLLDGMTWNTFPIVISNAHKTTEVRRPEN
jgi:hypothetical protein